MTNSDGNHRKNVDSQEEKVEDYLAEEQNRDHVDLENKKQNQEYHDDGQQVIKNEAANVERDEKEVVLNLSDNEALADEEDPKNIKKYVAADAPFHERLWEVLVTFWPLGLVAFGGPQAHVALLRTHLVTQRQWLDEETFIELFAIGQGLPGPTSTQLVISTALSRAGPLGGLLAFFLFNLPGFIVLTLCGVLIKAYIDPQNPPFWLVGLPPAAISLVFKAFYGFAAPLDKLGVILALISCLAAILINNDKRIKSTSSQFVFPSLLVLGGLTTLLDSKRAKPFSTYKSPSKGWDSSNDETIKRIGIPLYMGALIFLLWLSILIAVILLTNVSNLHSKNLDIFETTYRVGSIIFGGGQVVLPLLQDEVVPQWMTKDQFLQGLALAQSLPGPLFNFAAYLGAVYAGVGGAFVGFLGLFGPGVVLIFAVVPFWARLRHNHTFRCILVGVNATAIGLVGAACVVLWETAIENAANAMVFSLSLTLDVVFNVQAPLVVLAGGFFGAILHSDLLDLGQRPYCVQQGFHAR